MPYDLYSHLSQEQKARYDLMLETNYVLLRCDEWAFEEEDEHSTVSTSVSWIQSLQPTLQLFGLDANSYPQGSLSANRHYYEALRNFSGGVFPQTPEFSFLRQGLNNLLRLRRDDSSANLSYLLGSYYRIAKTVGDREQKKYRSVEVSLRHSATALWILCEESQGALTNVLQNSLVAFMDRMKRYLAKNEDWEKDGYRHLTLASAMNALGSTVRSFFPSEVTRRAASVKGDCSTALLSTDCLVRNPDGEYVWRVPPVSNSRMAKYEFYLNAFVLSQVPELLEDPKAQSVVRGMLGNRVNSEVGYGIPIHKLINFSTRAEATADFGATASCLYLLWYSLNNQTGGPQWLEYCENNMRWLLNFCLQGFDRKQFYVLPHSENNTKVLLLPRYNCDPLRKHVLGQCVIDLKRAINKEMQEHSNKLSKLLAAVETPGLDHVKKIIEGWQIEKYWKKQKSWGFTSFTALSEVGEFVGGLAVGTLKALRSSP